MNLSEQMAAAGAEEVQKKLQGDGLAALSLLAQEMLDLEAKIADLNAQASALTQKLTLIAENSLPSILEEYGLSEIKLADGKKIIVKPFISCTIKPENQEAAFKWLRDNDFGDIIKRGVSVAFGKGEDTTADKLVKTLLEKGYNVEDKTGVHTSTLKAFIKEQIEENNPNLPKALFNVFEGKRAQIKEK